jgi:hemerythrin superfamily protein
MNTNEEEAAKKALNRLEDMDTNSPEFLSRFAELRKDVESHAQAEEEYEFAHLRSVADRGRLESLAKAVKAAELLAPPRAHPGTDSALRNLVLPEAGRGTGAPAGQYR